MKRRPLCALFILTLLLIPGVVNSQEGFGFDDSDFGFSDDSSSSGFGFSGAQSFSVNISGEAGAELTGFYNDFGSFEEFKKTTLGDIFSGRLNFSAGVSAAQGIINLKLKPVFDGSSPVEIDEAFVRAFFGPVTLEGGLRKLSWGRADSFGPLDLINPLDYRDLTKLSNPQSVKIARPLVRAAWTMGSFTKLEAVFVPGFQGHKFAVEGRWTPNQLTGAYDLLRSEIEKKAALYLIMCSLTYTGDESDRNAFLVMREEYIRTEIEKWSSVIVPDDLYPDTKTLEYAQAGLRFTTTLGSSDLGFQYYFGRLPRPALNIKIDNGFLGSSDPSKPYDLTTNPIINTDAIHIGDFNYYHQIAGDFARVIAGFNLRAEAGINLTKDLNGSDGAVENPAIVWSLGFDRDLVWNINLNLQGTGKFRLFHSKIGNSLLTDCEAGTSLSSTRITGIVSRKFLRDELELKVTGLWGIEDRDFLVMPAFVWSRNDVVAQISAGIFGGDKEGELGQYRDNGFIRIILSYKF